MSVEDAKRKAAYAAVDEYVKDGMVVGVGSGSTVVYAVDRLIERVQSEKLKIKCIPTSYQSQLLIINGGLPLTSLAFEDRIDVTIDGADEVDPELNLIKGGGACHVQEKLIAYNSEKLVIIVDYRKIAPKTLGTVWTKGVPIEVIPSALQPVQRKLKSLGALSCDVRMGGSAKAGPVVTDNSNFIIDAHFGPIDNVGQLQIQLQSIAGLVDTGLFVKMASKCFIGNEDGSVSSLENSSAQTQLDFLQQQ